MVAVECCELNHSIVELEEPLEWATALVVNLLINVHLFSLFVVFGPGTLGNFNIPDSGLVALLPFGDTLMSSPLQRWVVLAIQVLGSVTEVEELVSSLTEL